MIKTLLKQTVTIDVTINDGAKTITGVNVIDTFQIADGDDVFTRDATPRQPADGEFAALVNEELARLRTANATLHEQNTAQQEQLAAWRALVDRAKAALLNVAEADAAWDDSPRAQVGAALTAITEAQAG